MNTPDAITRLKAALEEQQGKTLAGAGSPASERGLILITVLAVSGLVAWSDELHAQVLSLITLAEPVIARHPVSGAVLFAGLAAFSAMFLFFSSAVLVPIGVQAWGHAGCFFLLWSGWFLGGVVTYSVGRHLGRPVVDRMVSAETLARYEAHIPTSASFWTVVLFQLAVPSDVLGYLFGLVAFPMHLYLLALMLSELPYAIGTVFLGAAFMRGQAMFLLALAALALALALWGRRRWRG